MSDPNEAAHFAQALAQPHVGDYSDDATYALEQQRIFARCPRYVGHEAMVPEPGDWRTLPQEDGGRVLLRNALGEVQLLSNVCRHRQARILGHGGEARGNLAAAGHHIVCPLHAWTYTDRGELVGAPHIEPTPCRHLQRFALHRCNGLLFEGPRDPSAELAPLFARPEFDFSGHVLGHVEVHRCRCNWKTFIEIYNDDYHIGPFHPGLGRFVSCDALAWEFGDHHSLQRVSARPGLPDAGSPAYQDWRDRLLAHGDGQTPAFGAIWVSCYPTLMIEVFPQALVLSTLHPRGPRETLNTMEFYYPDEVLAFDPELALAHRTAYLETALEDDEIAERIDAGRHALHARGETDHGPYQSPMEDGMRHFHAWYLRMMEPRA